MTTLTQDLRPLSTGVICDNCRDDTATVRPCGATMTNWNGKTVQCCSAPVLCALSMSTPHGTSPMLIEADAWGRFAGSAPEWSGRRFI
jgi:hypothetical protein